VTLDPGRVEEILRSRGLVARCRRMGDVISCGVRLGRNYEATIDIYGEEKIDAIVPNGLSLAIVNNDRMFSEVARVLGVPTNWVEVGSGLRTSDLILSTYDVSYESVEKIADALSKLRNGYVAVEAKVTRARIFKRIVPRFAPQLPRIR